MGIALVVMLVAAAAAAAPGTPETAPAGPSAPTAPSAADAPDLVAAQASLGEMRTFILDKLAYDAEYFAKVVRAHEQGRTLPGLAGGPWQAEVTRANKNLPVLRRFVDERPGFDSGRPFTLPKDAFTFKEYRNLLALLNMVQAHGAGRAPEVLATALSMTVHGPDDFGKVRGAGADYYVSMFRAYFYLVGSAYYQKRDDKRAVEWFARLEADANLGDLKKKMATAPVSEAESRALRLETLRARPLALLPLVNQTGDHRLSYVGGAVAEVMLGDLAQGSDLVLVERSQLERVSEEMALKLAGLATGGEAARTAQLLGASTLLLGSYSREGDHLLLSLRLVDGEKETVLSAANGPAREDTLFADARKIALQVLAQVGWDSGILAEDFLSRHAPRAETARKLHDARLARATHADDARALYAQAMKEDPALANLYADLKAQFADLSATVAILPFTHVTGNPDDAWMARGVVEALSTDLPRVGFTVVERQRVDEALLARAGEVTFLDSREASGAGQVLGADYVVLGSVLHQAPALRVDLRVIEVGTSVIAYATSAENRRDDLAAAIVSLTAQIAERFNAPLSAADVDQLMASKVSPADFEQAMRAELARDRLTTAPAPTSARVDVAQIGRWSAVGGIAVGAGVAATGFLVAAPLGSRANQLHGLQSVVVEPQAQEDLRAERDNAAALANLWTGVGWVGAGLAAVGVGWLVVDAVLPDEEGDGAVAPAPASAPAGLGAR